MDSETEKSRCLVGVRSRLLITILDDVMSPSDPLHAAKKALSSQCRLEGHR